jgi:hypothetical protein
LEIRYVAYGGKNIFTFFHLKHFFAPSVMKIRLAPLDVRWLTII